MLTNAVVKAISNQLSCEMNGEAVILHMETGVYFGLDPVARRIWELVQEPRSFGNLVDALLNEYEIDRVTCERDVQQFLDQMKEAGLVEIQDGARR